MHATLDAVLERTRLPEGFSESDQELAHRYATELTRYGVGALPRELFEAPSGRRLARIACEDVEGIRAMQDRFAPREHTRTVTEEVQQPPTEEGAEPTTGTVTRAETISTAPRCLELSEGHGMLSLLLGLTFPDHHFHVREDHDRRRWLWRRMLLSFGVRNVELLPPHSRLAPGEWDLVLVKNCAPARAMDLAGSLLASGGDLLLWQDRQQAKGLRRRHLDARSRPLRLSAAVEMLSPAASGRLVARVSSAAAILDGAAAGA